MTIDATCLQVVHHLPIDDHVAIIIVSAMNVCKLLNKKHLCFKLIILIISAVVLDITSAADVPFN